MPSWRARRRVAGPAGTRASLPSDLSGVCAGAVGGGAGGAAVWAALGSAAAGACLLSAGLSGAAGLSEDAGLGAAASPAVPLSKRNRSWFVLTLSPLLTITLATRPAAG